MVVLLEGSFKGIYKGSIGLQYPLINGYTLNYSRTPNMIQDIFLNEGIHGRSEPKRWLSYNLFKDPRTLLF